MKISFNRSTKSIFFLMLLSVLSSCVTLPSSSAPHNIVMSWRARAHQLSSIQKWHLRGAISVHTAQQAVTAELNWQQKSKTCYQISLFGPLGMGSVVINGSAQEVVLKTGQGARYQSKTPNRLVKDALGWDLPVSALLYWIRGLPVSGVSSKQTFDAYHHLLKLQQMGWTIHYLRYTGVDSFDLPSLIQLQKGTIDLKIVINSWAI